MRSIFLSDLKTKGFSALLIWLISISGLLLVLVHPAVLSAKDNPVSATLTPLSFSTQQPARLVVTIEGRQDAEISIPEVDGLVFHPRGQSSQFQMINGKSSSSIAYSYLVQGTEQGEFTIPPITITTPEGTYKTKQIVCTVTDAPASLPSHRQSPSAPVQRVAGEQSDNVAFIKLIPTKEQAYVGELIPTTIKAYFHRGVKFKFNALPELKGEGFLINALSNEPQQHDEIIDDKRYMVLTWDTILTGIKEGQNDLDIEMDVSMLVPSRQQGRRLPGFGGGLQDDFFDDFFGRYESQPIKVTSPTVTMQVIGLPEPGKPDHFSGAIGTFSFDIQAQPKRIAPGDPITVTMSISGSGNFDNVSAPALTDVDGIKVYSPTSSFQHGSGQQEDRKVFEQAIVITDPAVSHIPPAVFSYFDPEKKQYQTLFTDPIDIELSGPAATAAQSPFAASSQMDRGGDDSTESDLLFDGLAPVKLTAGSFTGEIRPLFRQPLYILACALLLTAIAAVTGFRVRRHYLANNPIVLRRRKTEKARSSCIASFQAIQAADQSTYLETSQHNLKNFLALLWGCEAVSITTADIRQHLGSDHPITRLFIHGDNASYGASDFSRPDRDQLHKEIIEILATLT